MAESTVYVDSWNYLKLTVTETAVKVAENKSTITETLQLVLPYSGSNFRAYNCRAKVTGSSEVSLGYVNYYQGTYTLASASYDVTHNADGSKYYTSYGYFYTGIGNFDISCGIQLTKINRMATVSAVSDFNDETNPVITFTNPTSYQINAFVEVGNTRIATIENIASTSPYTVELTTAQRNQLRQLCTGKTLTVRVGIATCTSGTTESQWSYKDKTMAIVNGNPTFTGTYEDTNATTLAITSDDQQIIRNNSTLQINIADAEAKKYATLSSVRAIINGTTYNGTLSGTSGTINVGTLNLSSETVASVILTDSRGFETTHDLTLEILDWSTPTAIITLNRQNNFYSETDIKVDADYSSLDSKNAITLKVRSKKTTASTYGSYTTLTDNVTTTLTLDNNYQWDVQVLVQDLIGQTTYNLTIDRGIPIVFFDRLKRSVGIDCFPTQNTSLEVSGDILLNGNSFLDKVYPVGSIYMSVNNTDPSTLFGGTWIQIEDTFLLSAGSNYTAGDTGGAATVTLTIDQMPKHSHLESVMSNYGYPNLAVGNDANHPQNLYSGAGGYVSGGTWTQATGWANETNERGSGQAHNNMPPYLVVYMWKRTA